MLKACVLKDPQPQVFKCLPVFQRIFLNVDVRVGWSSALTLCCTSLNLDIIID